MFSSFGWAEALIILVVVLIVFGVGKLPQVGGALGKGIREFKRGKAGILTDDDNNDDDEDEDQPGKESKKKITGDKTK